ncbi:MAG TPA: hypothetical protein VF116_09245 [Ktedonobacterales bacterium]
MANSKNAGRAPRRRLPLTVRLSLLVLLAAILPLAAVVGVNDYFARGTLISQGTNTLTTDARAKSALITEYLRERVQDGEALVTLPTTPAYLTCIDAQALPPAEAAAVEAQANCASPTLGEAFYEGSNCRALHVGTARDKNYLGWSLFDGRGDALLTSSTQNCAPSNVAPAPKEDLAPVLQQGKSLISAVYYNAQQKFAYVQLYTPVAVPGAKQVLGFLRATLRLDYIYNIVTGESDANGSGSYAFIVDSNGVRIADAHQDDLFTAIAPLTANAEQLIASEQRYGSQTPPAVNSLPDVASALTASGNESSFQSIATAGANAKYQYVRERVAVVDPASGNAIGPDWTYFVLSPLTTVTQVADDQLKTSLLSAGVVAILAILFGLLIGSRTAGPVQGASGEVEGAAVALKLLASRQENSASEQQWVVDACKTGLDGVRYLSDAMNQAARRIMDASNWFNDYWDRLTEDQAKRTVQHLLELSRYIDEAARRQHASSERLDKAITVTIQVSDQLVAGASAATQSADALEQVVSNLQRVVGGRPRLANGAAQMDEVEQMEQLDAMGMGMGMAPAPMVAAPSGRGGQRGGRLALPMPMPQGPRGGTMGMGGPSGQMGGPGPFAPRAPRAPWNAGQPSQVFDDPYGQPGPGGGYDGYSQWGGPNGPNGPNGNGMGFPAGPRSQGHQPGPGRNGR